jgi:glycogen(starch) synthase
VIFELSWEVCNKVGGIHTVLSTKAKYLMNYYKNNFYFIGPYLENSKKEFKEEKLPDFITEDLIGFLKEKGIKIHYGTWLIEGLPKVFLIDFKDFFEKYRNEIKGKYWEWYKIDSLNSPLDYDEPLIWSTAAGIFLEKLSENLKFIVHGNEWLSAGAILWLKKHKKEIPTVLTYHGIMLARTLVQAGKNIYKMEINNPDKLAYEYNIQAKHLTERVASHITDVFTVVSEIMAKNSEKFLLKKPDLVTPNGIDYYSLPNLEECLYQHKVLKQEVKKFVMTYFFPYYKFNIDNTLFLFTASRYEFFSKGIDLLIDALGRLDKILRRENFNKTIVFFIFVPTAVSEIRKEIIESKNVLDSLEEMLIERGEYIRNQLLYHLLTKEEINFDDLFNEEELIEIERIINSIKKEGNPPLTTHYLAYDENNDAIIKALKKNGLTNSKENKIKVIWYPIYLSKNDKLLNLGYKDTIKAMHLGVFPSLYEPFGYTPLESASLAVPSVTTNVAGFGREILKIKKQYNEKKGVFVINRLSPDNGLDELTNILYDFVHFSKIERIKNKIAAKNLASFFDWSKLINNYIEAYNRATLKNKN